ncbi:ABC transporter ATP-binding protein, partial [Pseudomonas stutzeri]|nr:ABC transporter ATP-binding protein [Stutzerimonas stutzeri]
MKALEVQQLNTFYGKSHILHGIDIDVNEGELVTRLGRNGAGKTSMLHAVAGLIPKRAGRVSFRGRDITAADPRAAVRAGINVALEGHRVFTGLTVEDNLLLGTYATHRHGDRKRLPRIYDLFPELAEKRLQPASRLSGGQQQILAVAQGVIAEPELLILDEPSGGLAPLVVDRILTVAKDLTRGGMAVLLVEQLVKEALRFADYCYLVETGHIGGEGTPPEVQAAGTDPAQLTGRRAWGRRPFPSRR